VTDNAGRPAALDPAIAARLKRDANGLFAAIAQQFDTGEVLMLAWMDDEALHRTLTTGRVHLCRSRECWVKGRPPARAAGHLRDPRLRRRRRPRQVDQSAVRPHRRPDRLAHAEPRRVARASRRHRPGCRAAPRLRREYLLGVALGVAAPGPCCCTASGLGARSHPGPLRCEASVGVWQPGLVPLAGAWPWPLRPASRRHRHPALAAASPGC
jgi:hypothetical protein